MDAPTALTELKWYVIDGVEPPSPFRYYEGQIHLAIEDLIAAGDDVDQVIDQHLEELRQDLLAGWKAHEDRLREYTGDVQIVNGQVVLGGTQ